MKIDRKLNITMQVEQDDERTLYVHCSPIAQAVFEKYFMVMSKAFTAIYAGGLGAVSGPRVAAMMLKKIAIDEGDWDGPEGVERGLIGEMRRLTSVIAFDDKTGWTPIPLDLALQREALDEQDVSEVMNALCFFTLVSSINRKQDLRVALDMMGRFWGAQSTSSNSTEFARSLPTSTATANSGETEIRSSIPT